MHIEPTLNNSCRPNHDKQLHLYQSKDGIKPLGIGSFETFRYRKHTCVISINGLIIIWIFLPFPGCVVEPQTDSPTATHDSVASFCCVSVRHVINQWHCMRVYSPGLYSLKYTLFLNKLDTYLALSGLLWQITWPQSLMPTLERHWQWTDRLSDHRLTIEMASHKNTWLHFVPVDARK